MSSVNRNWYLTSFPCFDDQPLSLIIQPHTHYIYSIRIFCLFSFSGWWTDPIVRFCWIFLHEWKSIERSHSRHGFILSFCSKSMCFGQPIHLKCVKCREHFIRTNNLIDMNDFRWKYTKYVHFVHSFIRSYFECLHSRVNTFDYLIVNTFYKWEKHILHFMEDLLMTLSGEIWLIHPCDKTEKVRLSLTTATAFYKEIIN